jgi:uncharacterized protein (UPF0333 family)
METKENKELIKKKNDILFKMDFHFFVMVVVVIIGFIIYQKFSNNDNKKNSTNIELVKTSEIELKIQQ